MSNVSQLPASTTLTPELAIDSARGADLTEVLVVGYKPDGELFIRSSRMTRRDGLWMAEQLRLWALGL